MENKFLPIGTVVQLKDATARVMIAGYFPISAGQPDRVWDYSGFKFPIGYVNDDEVYCFDQDQIEMICVYGYQDLEQMEFMDYLMSQEQDIRKKIADGAAGNNEE